MKEAIQTAYERMTPDERTRDALLQRIQMQTRTQNGKAIRPSKRFLTAAACAALAAALSLAGFAVFGNRNPVKTLQSSLATAAAATGSVATGDKRGDSTQNAPAALTDAELTQKAAEILQMLDLKGLTDAQSHIVRTENDTGTEAEVYFSENGNIACVKFHEPTGALLGVTCMDRASDGTACASREDAEALAKRYYELFPVPQGYGLREYQELNAERWDFLFEREVREGIYSPYESVRVSVDPQKGSLRQCTVQSVPLSDDHAPDDVPLTAEEAEALARACLKNEKSYRTKSRETEVVQPETPALQNFTRLAWTLVFENPNSEQEDRVTVSVDSYTGEILVMGATL